MNALVGQEAKANFSLFWRFCDDGADDGGRKDGGDFAATQDILAFLTSQD